MPQVMEMVTPRKMETAIEMVMTRIMEMAMKTAMPGNNSSLTSTILESRMN
jgi:hypothetical protein